MALHHFLLIYNVKTQLLVDAKDLGVDMDAAVTAYADCEDRYSGNRDIEVVLIGSDSIETVMKTHGHYFGQIDDFEFFETVRA